ncbi:MAG: protein kinase [Synechococcus sp.]
MKVAKILFAAEDFFQEQTSRVFVQLWEAGEQTQRTSGARLNADPKILELYEQWRQAYKKYYRHLSLRDDFEPLGTVNRTREEDAIDLEQLKGELQHCSHRLVSQFNDWLSTQPEFREGVENWLGDRFNLDDDEIRIAIESDDPNVRRLPWQAWKLLERFDRAELSIGDTYHDSRKKPPAKTKGDRLKLLAVFGYAGGLNLDEDRQTIAGLPNIEAEFCVQPSLQGLKTILRQEPWDVFYFGGHSSSDSLGQTGVLYLDSQTPIAISQLKGALKTAVRDGGLQLGIFNSCDGLGLAAELEDVHFPLSIVMREPVPNVVAQRFLKYFLQAYTRGKPLYLALRQARLLLEDDSEELPYVHWLPAIAHDTSTNPLLWQDFVSEQESQSPNPHRSVPQDLTPPGTVPTRLRDACPSQPERVPTKLAGPPPIAETVRTFTPTTLLGGAYEVIDNLSSGGFSVTYLARALDLPGQPHCAIKQLKPIPLNADMARARQMFQREAEILFKLGSSTDRIPTLYASFEQEGEFYLVQEYIGGEELGQELRRRGRLSESETLELLKDILEGLEIVHNQDIIHRDIKPSNLMRRKSDGKIVLIDFGAVKDAITIAAAPDTSSVQRGASVVGSPGFMAPEQSLGHPQQCSDIFSVGSVAIWAITGQPPIQSISSEGVTGALVRRDRVQLSDGMAELLYRMTDEESQNRFVDATEALRAVKQLRDRNPKRQSPTAISQITSSETPVSSRSASRQSSRLSTWVTIGIAALAVLGGGWLAWILLFKQDLEILPVEPPQEIEPSPTESLPPDSQFCPGPLCPRTSTTEPISPQDGQLGNPSSSNDVQPAEPIFPQTGEPADSQFCPGPLCPNP